MEVLGYIVASWLLIGSAFTSWTHAALRQTPELSFPASAVDSCTWWLC